MDTIKPAEITFDTVKNEANIRERGLPFSLVKDEFDWASAQVIEDRRRPYGEQRYRAFGLIGMRNRREVRRYGEKAESVSD